MLITELLVIYRLKMVKVQINGRLEAAHKIIIEISLLIMDKSWNNHGILISNFCGNPGLYLAQISGDRLQDQCLLSPL